MLKRFDAELLLGRISNSQKAEIYNYSHGYPVLPKKCSTLKKDEIPVPPKRYVYHNINNVKRDKYSL